MRRAASRCALNAKLALDVRLQGAVRQPRARGNFLVAQAQPEREPLGLPLRPRQVGQPCPKRGVEARSLKQRAAFAVRSELVQTLIILGTGRAGSERGR